MDEHTLESLKDARWAVARRTFGNNHSSLIGLVVDWWVTAAPDTRWALESGPSLSRGNSERADGLLGDGTDALGVFEVEGSRHAFTLAKLGKFLVSERADLASLRFGLFLGYRWEPGPLPVAAWEAQAQEITRQCPGRSVIVSAVEKAHRRTGPWCDGYYAAMLSRVDASLVTDGAVVHRLSLSP